MPGILYEHVVDVTLNLHNPEVLVRTFKEISEQDPLLHRESLKLRLIENLLKNWLGKDNLNMDPHKIEKKLFPLLKLAFEGIVKHKKEFLFEIIATKKSILNDFELYSKQVH